MRGLCLVATLLAAPAAAQDAAWDARNAAAELGAAVAALEQADGAGARIAALTGIVAAGEAGLGALREGLRQIAARERALAADLSSRQAEIGRLTAALATLERDAEPRLLLHPDGPLGAARGAMLLAEAVPALARRAEALGAELAVLRDLRALEASAASDISAGLVAVQEARAALSEALAERTGLPAPPTGAPVGGGGLRAQVGTLDTFADRLAALAPEAVPALDLPMELPVAGRLLRRAGETDAAGIARPGWVLATEAGAVATAPAGGTIRYAGPLLDYGNVIVLEPAAGMVLVFAGLAKVYVVTGALVPAGAPLGRMGGASPGPGGVLRETLTDSGAPRPETIYIEVRRDGRPTDPAEFFAMQQAANRETR